jgi:CHAD domain-containing protein
MVDGKWFLELTAASPVDEAAALVIEARLTTIRDALAPALDVLNPDPEPIHQLRVGARRATVALDLFEACFPEKTYRRIRRALRDLRRSAGQARDWDVFLLTLTEKSKARTGVRFLLGYTHGQRLLAQEAIDAAAETFSDRLSGHWESLFQHLKAPNSRTLLPLAQDTLNAQLRELRAATEESQNDLAHLHQVRIIGKRLRYSMEIFAGCFAEPFREILYPRVEEMQEILGTLNDSRVAVEKLTMLRGRLRAVAPSDWRAAKPEIEHWLRYHRGRIGRQRSAFAKWLLRWNASHAENEFAALLELASTTAV